MVPRLSSQLCGGKWQARQKHVEFFTRAHCVPTLTPSWVLWDGPELCLDSVGLRWLCQQAWPCSSLFFSLSLHRYTPPLSTPSLPPSLADLASTLPLKRAIDGVTEKLNNLQMASWAKLLGAVSSTLRRSTGDRRRWSLFGIIKAKELRGLVEITTEAQSGWRDRYFESEQSLKNKAGKRSQDVIATKREHYPTKIFSKFSFRWDRKCSLEMYISTRGRVLICSKVSQLSSLAVERNSSPSSPCVASLQSDLFWLDTGVARCISNSTGCKPVKIRNPITAREWF